MVFEYFLLLRFFLDLKSTKENGKASLVQEIILLGGVSLLGLLMIVVMFLLIGTSLVFLGLLELLCALI